MPTYLDRQSAAGGGGGGAGRSNNFGSSGASGGIRVLGQTATLSGGSLITQGQAGTGSNYSATGSGGYRGEDLDYGDTHAIAGDGGNGGFWGAAGAAGQGSQFANKGGVYSGGGSGGAAGLAVNGNANITWGATGTRYGGII